MYLFHSIVLIQFMLLFARICSHSNPIRNEHIQNSGELTPVVIGHDNFILQWIPRVFGGDGSFLIDITGHHVNNSGCHNIPLDCDSEDLCTLDTNDKTIHEVCPLQQNIQPCDNMIVYVTRKNSSSVSFNLAPLITPAITPEIYLDDNKMNITWDKPSGHYIECATRAKVVVQVGDETMNSTAMNVSLDASNSYTEILRDCFHGPLNATVIYLSVVGDYETDAKFVAEDHPYYKGVGVTSVTTDVLDQNCSIIVTWGIACPQDVEKYIVYWGTEQAVVNTSNTIYTIEDVKADKYTASVQAYWNGGSEMGNAIVSEPTIVPQKAPAAPTIIYVNGNDINPTELSIKWQKPDSDTCTGEITGYSIIYHETGDNMTKTEHSQPESNEFNLHDLKACTSYSVQVAAEWSGGIGESDIKAGVTGGQDPGKPILNVTSVGPTRIGLRWDQPAADSCPVNKYTVNWTSDNGIGNGESLQGNCSTYNITGLICNKEYIIDVTAYTENNKSFVSESEVCLTKDMAPGQITIINASAIKDVPTKLNVKWSAPEYNCTGSSLGDYSMTWTVEGDDKPIGLILLSNTHCIIGGLAPCTSYIISVTSSSNTSIVGLPGTAVAATAVEALPVTNLNINSTSRNAVVTWKRPETNCKLTYVVKHSGTTLWTNNQTSGPGYDQLISDPSVTAALENLLPYSNYTVCVNVEDGELTCKTFLTDPDVPSAPRNVSVQENSITDDSLILTWQFPEEENSILEKYIILWSLGSQRTSNIFVDASLTSYTISGLDRGNYSFSVMAVNNNEDISSASEPIYVFLKGPWDQYYGYYDKIWMDEQCPTIQNHNGTSLSECKSLCNEVPQCTAFNYRNGALECVLRNCPLPIPYPTWNNASWQGYEQINDLYRGPYDKIWNEAQCPAIGNHDRKSLSECMALCDELHNCTAINYMDGVLGCVLRNCPLPIPDPVWEYASWQGYEQISGINVQKKDVVLDRNITGSKAVCGGTCIGGIVIGILLIALVIPAFIFRNRLMNKIIKKRGFLQF